jgi:hypothetical protein
MYKAVGIRNNRNSNIFLDHGSHGEMHRNMFLARREVQIACTGDMQLLMMTCGRRKIYCQTLHIPYPSPWLMF